VNTWVWHQVSLELGNINVQGTIETERCREGRDNLSDETIQVGVRWALNVEGTTADIVHGFVVKHDGNVSVLEKRVRGQHGIVWFYDGRGDLRTRVDGETQFGFTSVIYRQTLKEQRSETGSSTTTDGVETHETLKASAVVGKFSQSVKD
jgi:hypothetical protein